MKNKIENAVILTNGKISRLVKLFNAIDDCYVLGLFSADELDTYYDFLFDEIVKQYGKDKLNLIFAYFNQ